MLTRLALKELRETLWIAAVALAILLFLTFETMGLSLSGWQDVGAGYAVPFVTDDFVPLFVTVAGCLAVALGLRQTLLESIFGTYPFLLHRPAARWQLIGTKLLVGLGLYLVFSVVPIVIYACWAATPGTHASPFKWSMTWPAWQVWLAMTMVYLAAFHVGIRPARWLGTRLLPAVAVVGLVGVLMQPPWWSMFVAGTPWCWPVRAGVLGVIVLVDVLLAANIFYVAKTRDY